MAKSNEGKKCQLTQDMSLEADCTIIITMKKKQAEKSRVQTWKNKRFAGFYAEHT